MKIDVKAGVVLTKTLFSLQWVGTYSGIHFIFPQP